MSHRGSLLCLPDGIWAWPVDAPAALTEEALSLSSRAAAMDFFILGTGDAPWSCRKNYGNGFATVGLSVDAMLTGPRCDL